MNPPPVLKKKICLLGAFAVGKTSLIQRYVRSTFSDKYQTTIGVKIDQKSVLVDDTEVQLVIWDIHGQDDFQKVRSSYLKGASAFFLVVDATRARTTIDTALQLYDLAKETQPQAPFVLLVNKMDLAEQTQNLKQQLNPLLAKNWPVISTSAKTGDGVEEAFQTLSRKLVNHG